VKEEHVSRKQRPELGRGSFRILELPRLTRVAWAYKATDDPYDVEYWVFCHNYYDDHMPTEDDARSWVFEPVPPTHANQNAFRQWATQEHAIAYPNETPTYRRYTPSAW
jgi:hypothetical protein